MVPSERSSRAAVAKLSPIEAFAAGAVGCAVDPEAAATGTDVVTRL
jgi:hypothetical protein